MSSESMVDSEEEIEEHVSKSNQGMTFPETIDFFAKRTNLDDPLYEVVSSSRVIQKYAQKSLQPNLEEVSRKALRRKIIQIYLNSKKDLKKTFANLDGGLTISCDLWTSFNGEDHYLCIICHWVREDAAFKNHVIGFEMLYPFDYANIASKIIQVLDEYNLLDKVEAISFEDSFSKEKCMEHLVKEFDPILLEMFFLDRTFANVVDLCGQQIVDQLGLFINPIRELLKWFRCSDKNQEFRTLCKEMGLGLPMKTFCFDFSKNWKTTIKNLWRIYDYKGVLTKLYNECEDHCPLEDSQWDAINSMINLIWKFNEVADKFSSVYDVSCHLVIQDCIGIVHKLGIYESDPRFGSVVRDIRSKWLELFPDIPTIYCVATILDPHVKVEGLRQLLAYYYETLGVKYDVDEKVAYCMNVLKQLLIHYAPPCEPATSSGEGKNKSNSSLELNVIRDVLKRKREDDQERSGELGNYLSYEFEFSDYFDILEWWHNRRETLPVLSKVAKEVLCTPLSTIIPGRTRCPGKRVLDEKRSMLPPGLLRVCICKADWDLAKKSNQDATGYNFSAYDTDFEEDY